MKKIIIALLLAASTGCAIGFRADYDYPPYHVCRYHGGLDYIYSYYYTVEYVCGDGSRFTAWRDR